MPQQWIHKLPSHMACIGHCLPAFFFVSRARSVKLGRECGMIGTGALSGAGSCMCMGWTVLFLASSFYFLGWVSGLGWGPMQFDKRGVTSHLFVQKSEQHTVLDHTLRPVLIGGDSTCGWQAHGRMLHVVPPAEELLRCWCMHGSSVCVCVCVCVCARRPYVVCLCRPHTNL
jgi:hypothetical protein